MDLLALEPSSQRLGSYATPEVGSSFEEERCSTGPQDAARAAFVAARDGAGPRDGSDGPITRALERLAALLAPAAPRPAPVPVLVRVIDPRTRR
ncbi:MAG: hypothetical protein IT307_09370 [Chloroflexi bacterium]|nr:hypothetical protein [Chloroflexota bacterium]